MRSLFLVVLLAAASPAFGRYVRQDVEQVPVARLVENLKKIAKDNPNSVEALLNLGRAHGMAYAQKVDPLTVPKAHHGIQMPNVPFNRVRVAVDPEQKANAQAHLESALKSYRQALELDKENLVVRLGVAWLSKQAGNTDEALPSNRGRRLGKGEGYREG